MTIEVFKMLVRGNTDRTLNNRWFKLIEDGWCKLEPLHFETEAILFHVLENFILNNVTRIDSWNEMLEFC